MNKKHHLWINDKTKITNKIRAYFTINFEEIDDMEHLIQP